MTGWTGPAGRLARFVKPVERATARDLALTAGSRGVQMLIGLAGNVLSARSLGPADLGRFSVIITAVMVGGTIADVGLTYATIRYIARNNEENPARARLAAQTYFLMRALSGVLTAILCMLISAPIASGILGNSQLTPLLQISFLTLISLSISSYPGTVLSGLSLFGRSAVAGLLNAIITVGAIGALFVSGSLSLPALVLLNVFLPVMSTLPAWWLIPGGWLPWQRAADSAQEAIRIGKDLLGFGKWIVLSLLASVIALQGDLVVLSRLLDPTEVGIYSVALALAMRLDLVNQSLYMVMMPRASRLRGSTQVRGYIRSVLTVSGILSCGLGVAALLARPLIVLLYGTDYAEAGNLFLILLVAVLLELFTGSLFLLAFPLNKPRTLAIADWLRVAVLLIGTSLMAPLLGSTGAAVARLFSRVAGSTIVGYSLRRDVQTLPSEEDSGTPAPPEAVPPI